MLTLPRRFLLTCVVILLALALSNAVQVLLIVRHPDAAARFYSAPRPASAPLGAVPVPPRLGWTYGGIQATIRRQAAAWGQSGYWMNRVAWCESGDNPNVTNAWSGAAGLFQFTWPTFNGWVHALSWPRGTWLSPYNPSVAARLAAYMWRRGQAGQWSCSYLVGYLVGAGHARPGTGPWPMGCGQPLVETPPSCWTWLPQSSPRGGGRAGP